MKVDASEVKVLTNALESLQMQFSTDRHLHVVTKSAFEILESQFLLHTHLTAGMLPEQYHHVYEWEHIGIPGAQLFNTNLKGLGGSRRVTWGWRASKTTVPTDVGITGEPRWENSPSWFNPDRLNRVHVFVWKAPMMEYGTTVTVRPKLGNVLVFENPDLLGSRGRRGAAGSVTFTPHPVTFTPGGKVAGNFTAHFIGWWGGGIAQTVLDKTFEKDRDNAFHRLFESKVGAATTKRRKKSFSIMADAAAARQGKNIARAIAGDMEHKYIEMARRRKRNVV